VKPWHETYPKKYWTAADWAEARRLGVAPPELPDIERPEARLFAEQAQTGPRLSWGRRRRRLTRDAER
jgi:hypothetical protein